MPDTSIAFQIGGLTLRWYGILISLSLALGIYLASLQAKKRGYNPEEVFNLSLLILPAAIIGARLYYILMEWSYYGQNPGEIIKIWEGGLAFHGGFILAVIAAFLYMRRKKLKFLPWADIFIPFVALGQSLGRWGNYFNKEAYGYETDLPWGILINGVYRHPTFLYESLWDFGLFIFLYKLINKPSKTRPYKGGSGLAWYLILYSLGRFFIEALRTDSLMLGSFRVAQLVSVLGVILGLGLLFYLRKAPGVFLSSKGNKAAAQKGQKRRSTPKKKQNKNKKR